MTHQLEMLFVYGALKQGGQLHSVIESSASARFVGRAHTMLCFDLLDLGAFPGMVVGSTGWVWGELFAVPPTLLPILDTIEGAPGLFRRQAVDVCVTNADDLEPVEAHAYIYQRSRAWHTLLPRGEWELDRVSRSLYSRLREDGSNG